MKRIVLLFAACLGACLLAGAQKRIPLLEKVPGHRVSCSYAYSLSKDGAPFSEVTSGSLEVEDNAFRLDALGLRLLSDGTIRWTLDDEAKEAVVETVSREDIVTNPALLLSEYTRFGDQITVNGSSDTSLDVTLELDSATRARFVLKDIVFSAKQGKSDFSLEEKSLPKDYLVTDLR